MNNKNTINRTISMEAHNYLYKTRFSDKIRQLYLTYFEKNNKDSIRDLKNMINYIEFTRVSFADIYDEDFDINGTCIF